MQCLHADVQLGRTMVEQFYLILYILVAQLKPLKAEVGPQP